MERLQAIARALEAGDDEKVTALTQGAIDEGFSPHRILNEGLVAGMQVVGEQFRAHEIFLPDVLLAARAMNAGLALLKPLLIGGAVPSLGRVVLGSVKGDMHDIGKNLVGIMLKGAGFEIIDLGNDVDPVAFVDAAVSRGAGVIGMSALITTTMPMMKHVVDIVEARGLRGRIKTIVGGAPVSRAFAEEIGADDYAYDAANAVERVKRLMAGATQPGGAR